MFNRHFKNLTNHNQYLTDTENQFYKVSVILVKYRFTKISTLNIFTDITRY